jgi:hypothetical protein
LLRFIRKDDSFSTAELAPYITPQLPAANVFIKKKQAASSDANVVHDSRVELSRYGWKLPDAQTGVL